jgi:hypothetical protein
MDRLRRRPFVCDDWRSELELAATAISRNFRERSEEITDLRHLENWRAPPWGFKRSYLWKSGGVELAARAMLLCCCREQGQGVRPELTRREAGRQLGIS